MTASLSCPRCGAPASAGIDSTQCDYCGSALATVSCPSCFEAMFAGMQFCPSCGSKADHAFEENARSLSCPGCENEMRRVRVGSTPMYECSSCASNWLDTETFAAMCSNREERGAVASILGASKESAAVPGGAIRYLPCPLCKKLMNRTNFGHRSGVIIDVCKGHGAWFQPRELRNVLLFVDGGGFERARAEDSKQRDEDRRKLEQAFADAAPAGPSRPFTFRSVTGKGAASDSLIRQLLDGLLS
ncbi:MAG: zinc ribbon domain-containing protein [Gemmatimonadaceae bacterium]